jgi:Protein of unknown function (DUF2815)
MESTLIITNARLGFNDIWAPKEYKKGDGKPRYSVNALIPKNDPQVQVINKLFEDMFKEEYREKAAIYIEAVRGDRKQFCLLDGDKKDYDGYPGNIVITGIRHPKQYAKPEDKPPRIIGRDKQPLLEKDGRPYAGCYVNVKFDFYIQDNENGRGFRCTPLVVQFVKDGDAFSTGKVGSIDDMPETPEDEIDALV